MLTLIGAVFAVPMVLTDIQLAHGIRVSTCIVLALTLLTASALAWVLYWVGVEDRRKFIATAKDTSARILGGLLLLTVVVSAFALWEERERRNDKFRRWFHAACGSPVDVQETSLETTRCYRCQTYAPIPTEVQERIEAYGGPSAFAAGVRVCTSDD